MYLYLRISCFCVNRNSPPTPHASIRFTIVRTIAVANKKDMFAHLFVCSCSIHIYTHIH